MKDAFVFGLFLVLAILVSPFILVVAGIYLVYRIKKVVLRKRLLEQIEQEWFPKGKYIFFLYSNSKKWKEYFEQELIIKIQDKAVIWNGSTRERDGWSKDGIESKILSLYRPRGYFFPMAIVFLPARQVKTFQFYSSYVGRLKSGKDEYQKLEKEFLELADSLGREQE